MPSSILDEYVGYVEVCLLEGLSNQEIVASLKEEFSVKTTEASVRRLINRPGNDRLREAADRRNAQLLLQGHTEAPGVTVEDDQVLITLPPGVAVEDLTTAEILERHNLDPEEWEVERIMSNQWEANAGRNIDTGNPTKIILFQFKVYLKRKTPIRMVFPIVEPTWPERARLVRNDPYQMTKFGVVMTDHQSPHHDKQLHELACYFLEDTQPDFGIIAGDGLDNSMISRHRDDPAWDVPVQQGLQSFFDVLYDYTEATPDTEWDLIHGNHDDRIRNEILERAERLYGISPAQWPGEEEQEWVMSLRHLLNLDRLGINYAFDHGSYEFQQVNITALLAARHGHKVVKDGALKTAIELGHSVILGHTHRQSVTRKTIWNSILGSWSVITAIEAGCMCSIEGGIGFANGGAPDWQPGFATVTTFPDGNFTWDHAIYTQDGKLRWRDQEFSV